MPPAGDGQLAAFPPSVVGVETAVPAFIGYTERAAISGEPAYMKAIKIGSMADFESIFGGADTAPEPLPRFNLYNSLQLFYANGGSNGYIVSVGSYLAGAHGVDSELLSKGLDVIRDESGPTMLLIPDAVLLKPGSGDPKLAWQAPQSYWDLMNKMIDQAGELQDRVAILDVYGSQRVVDSASLGDVVSAFQDNIKSEYPSYGVAYFPFLNTFILGKNQVLPPSGAMAGVYTSSDATRGVWNAPANISLAAVVGPTYNLTSEAQGDLNVPVNGKAIDAIRELTGRGTVVWGARTLDGNSSDYRYIQVRRTSIYIEQSIKAALDRFVFAPNDGNTWSTVVAMISSFLQGVWSQGGLMGRTASEAFSVQCGLGSTMTPEDVLEGYMRVQVLLQMIRPAEFIELTFKQKMEGVG